MKATCLSLKSSFDIQSKPSSRLERFFRLTEEGTPLNVM